MNFGPHPITLRQLQYVVAVAEARNFSRAAERCMVSQPSLSAQIGEVERVLGLQLFERDRRRVLVTGPGEALVAHARRVLVEVELALEAMERHLDPLAGTLRLGVIPTIGPYLVPDIDPALRAAFPELRLLWTEDKTDALVARVKAGTLEAALLAVEADLGGLEVEIIGRDPFLYACPRSQSRSDERPAVNVSVLDDEEVLLLDDGHCFRDQALDLCNLAGARELGFRATSLATLVQMVAGGHGVTLLPQLAVEVENRHGLLTTRPFEEPQPHRTIAFAWRSGSGLGEAIGELARVGRAVFDLDDPG